uniref:Transmembrane protein n=1 Tax=Micrurus spixii TaxID=129469 RepID=A0A2D4MTE1_9SAUR
MSVFFSQKKNPLSEDFSILQRRYPYSVFSKLVTFLNRILTILTVSKNPYDSGCLGFQVICFNAYAVAIVFKIYLQIMIYLQLWYAMSNKRIDVFNNQLLLDNLKSNPLSQHSCCPVG